MNKTASAFFAVGAVFALIGMAWGIQMSASGDHSLSPAHGHLNLIGFVASSVYGAFYALIPNAAASRLAKIHLGSAIVGVLLIVPGIVMAITQQGETFAKIGSIVVLLSMLIFFVQTLRAFTRAA